MPVRGIAWAAFLDMLPSFARRGLGANAMIRAAAEQGYSFRAGDMFRAYRKQTGLARLGGGIKVTPSGTVYGKTVIMDTDLPEAKRYYYRFSGTFQHSETGQTLTKPLSYYADERFSDPELIADFNLKFPKSEVSQPWNLVDIEMGDIQHNKGMRW